MLRGNEINHPECRRGPCRRGTWFKQATLIRAFNRLAEAIGLFLRELSQLNADFYQMHPVIFFLRGDICKLSPRREHSIRAVAATGGNLRRAQGRVVDAELVNRTIQRRVAREERPAEEKAIRVHAREQNQVLARRGEHPVGLNPPRPAREPRALLQFARSLRQPDVSKPNAPTASSAAEEGSGTASVGEKTAVLDPGEPWLKSIPLT